MLLLFLSYVFRGIPNSSLIFGIIIILYETALPIEILRYLGMSARSLNIYAHNIDTIIDLALPPYGNQKNRPHFSAIGHELLVLAKTMALIFLPYIACYWLYYSWLANSKGVDLVFSFNMPPALLYEIMLQVFVVAVPEEIFYRGFLQGALLQRWPNRKFIAGMPVGFAVLVTNSIFAFGHVAVSLSPIRLLTFFPGLIFSYLVYKNKSLLSAILFHAACNILGQILYASLYLN